VAQLTDDANLMAGVRACALDPGRADALRSRNEELTGERFPLS
jgi:hypothetical protein